MGGYLTMQGQNGVRIWVEDGLYSIQRRRKSIPDKTGNLQEAWESLTENGQMLLFTTWQEALKYIDKNHITS